jgi:carbon storage regulator
MLVLTRKLGEKIRIDDTITVSIVEIDSRHVKIGVEAPRNVIVHREEVYQRIQEENQRAAGVEKVDIQGIAKMWKEKKNPS